MLRTICCALFVFASLFSAAHAEDRPSTRTGEFRDFPAFPSTILHNTRPVYVLLPPSYDSETTRRYPVLYAMDAQNLFDEKGSFIGKEWQLDETLAKLWSEKRVPEIIVVGVGHAGVDRMKEFMPGPDGTRFIRFLTNELKPFIDNRFRTKKGPQDTAMMGSSMGAMISAWGVVTRPDVFGQAAALSPSLQFADPIRELLTNGARPPVRLYMDMGSAEGPDAKVNEQMVAALNEARDGLKMAGYQEGTDFVAYVIPGAQHNEPAWAARLDRPLEFLFAPKTYKP